MAVFVQKNVFEKENDRFSELKNSQMSLNRPRSVAKERYTVSYAIKKGYFNLVRCLLSLGTDANFVNEKESFLKTPLIYSLFIKDPRWALSVLQNLLEYGACLKQTDSRMLNPIHYCCAFGRDDLLEVLLSSLDFDLSNTVDRNGNTCMHYAIRSHNLRCVNLLIRKFKTSNMSNKINAKNKLGLRPMDIEDDPDWELPKNVQVKNMIFNGKDSLEDCKKFLRQFIKMLSMPKVEPNVREVVSSEKEIKIKAKKNKKSKSKEKELNEKSEFYTIDILESKELIETDTIQLFKTQIDETEFKQNIKRFHTSSALGSNYNHLVNKSRPKTSLNHRSKKEEYADRPEMPQRALSIDLSNTKSDLIGSNSRNQSPEILYDRKTCINLTSKSFLLDYKEFALNFIEYNDLFYAKEHLIQNALNETTSPSRIGKRSNAPSRLSDYNDKKKTQSQSSNFLSDWKQEIPNVFTAFENCLTPSYRPSVHPVTVVTKKSKNLHKHYLELKYKLKHVSEMKKTYPKTSLVRNSHSSFSKHDSHSNSDNNTNASGSVSDDESKLNPLYNSSTHLTIDHFVKKSYLKI